MIRSQMAVAWPLRSRLEKARVAINQQYPYGFRWWHIALPIKQSHICLNRTR